MVRSGSSGKSTQGSASEQVCDHVYMSICSNLTNDQDEDRLAIEAQGKTIKTAITITTDENGEPEIPSVTQGSGYQTKVVQTALRDYCNAHISTLDILFNYPYTYICAIRIHLRTTESEHSVGQDCQKPNCMDR